MPWSPDAKAPRDRSAWLVLAAAVLGFQGVTAILYSAILPPVLTDIGIDAPLLGHMSVVWIGAGGLAIVSAVGVARRRDWGRQLGTLSEILSIMTGLLAASSAALALFVPILPLIVLYALRRRPVLAPERSRPNGPPAPPVGDRGPTPP
jgi:hypothetical protein